MNQILPLMEERKGKLLPCCCICEKVPGKGIRGGWRLKKAFICEDCEKMMVGMNIDSPQYDDLKEKIKKILK